MNEALKITFTEQTEPNRMGWKNYFDCVQLNPIAKWKFLFTDNAGSGVDVGVLCSVRTCIRMENLCDRTDNQQGHLGVSSLHTQHHHYMAKDGTRRKKKRCFKIKPEISMTSQHRFYYKNMDRIRPTTSHFAHKRRNYTVNEPESQ